MSSYRSLMLLKYKGKRRPGEPGIWYQCHYCGEWCTRDEITIDHIRPRCMYRDDRVECLQLLCRSCNQSKSDSLERMQEDYSRAIRRERLYRKCQECKRCKGNTLGEADCLLGLYDTSVPGCRFIGNKYTVHQ